MTNAPEVTVSYTFRIVDRERLESGVSRLIAHNRLAGYEPYPYLLDAPTDERMVLYVVSGLDVLAHHEGRVFTWEDLGLERVG